MPQGISDDNPRVVYKIAEAEGKYHRPRPIPTGWLTTPVSGDRD